MILARPIRDLSGTHIGIALSIASLDVELEPYRQMVLGVATAVAEAKKGVSPSEDAVISAIKEALGAA